jgi:hypothetical protein
MSETAKEKKIERQRQDKAVAFCLIAPVVFIVVASIAFPVAQNSFNETRELSLVWGAIAGTIAAGVLANLYIEEMRKASEG